MAASTLPPAITARLGDQVRAAGEAVFVRRKDDIEEKRLSLLSPMPANLVDTIPEKDFHDLISYLLTQRAK